MYVRNQEDLEVEARLGWVEDNDPPPCAPRITEEFLDQLILNEGIEKMSYVVSDESDLGYKLRQITAVEKQIETFKSMIAQSKIFYENKAQKAAFRMEMLKASIADFLTKRGGQSVATPYGTAYMGRTTKKSWPDMDVLVQFMETYGKDRIITTQSVLKSDVTEVIKTTGALPEGYLEKESEELRIRGV